MAQKAVGTKGMFHHAQIEALRSYISYRPEVDIIAEIHQITDKAVFNILLEVGLNATLQAELSKRWLKIQ